MNRVQYQKKKEELVDFSECDSLEDCINTIENSGRSLVEIARVLRQANIPKEIKDDAKRYIIESMPAKKSIKNGNAVFWSDASSYIKVLFVLDLVLEYMQDIATMYHKMYPEQKSYLRSVIISELFGVADYDKKIEYFMVFEDRLQINEKESLKLFEAQPFCYDENIVASLIQAELKNGHPFLLRNLIHVFGYHKVCEMSGITARELAVQIEHMELKSVDKMLEARILACHIHEYIGDNSEYMAKKLKEYAEIIAASDGSEKDFEVNFNMFAYCVYMVFLQNKAPCDVYDVCKNVKKEVLSFALSEYVIHAFIDCVEMLRKENGDILAFLKNVKPVNGFDSDTQFYALRVEALEDGSQWGFRKRVLEAGKSYEELVTEYTDVEEFAEIFMNTHYSRFISFRKFVYSIMQKTDDVSRVLGKYRFRGYVDRVFADAGKVGFLVKTLGYDIENIFCPFGMVRFDISEGINVTYPIAVRINDENRVSFVIPALEERRERKDMCEFLTSLAIDSNAGELLKGYDEHYSYEKAAKAFFVLERNKELQTLILKVLNQMLSIYDTESIVDIYMNSFFRTHYPLEFLCSILIRNNRDVMKINDILRRYVFKIRIVGENAKPFAVMSCGQCKLKNAEGVMKMYYFQIENVDESARVALEMIASEHESFTSVKSDVYMNKRLDTIIHNGVYDIKTLPHQNDIANCIQYEMKRTVIADFIEGLLYRIEKDTHRMSHVKKYLKSYEKVNPFLYQKRIDKKVKYVFTNQYNYLRNVNNYKEKSDAALERLINSGAEFETVCYIYLNSLMSYEIELDTFLNACVDAFVTESTVNDSLTLKMACVSGEVQILGLQLNDDVKIVLDEEVSNGYYMFQPDLQMDGSICAVNIEAVEAAQKQKHIIKLPPDIKTLADYFERKDYRLNGNFMNIVVSLLSEKYPTLDRYVTDEYFGEYRLFGRVEVYSKKAVFVPLNVKVQSSYLPKMVVRCNLEEIDTKAVYEAIPIIVTRGADFNIMLIAKYKEDSVLSWKNCIRTSDVEAEPEDAVMWDYAIDVVHFPNLWNDYLMGCKDESLREIISGAIRRTFRYKFNWQRIIEGYMENCEDEENILSEVADALDGYYIFFTSERILNAAIVKERPPISVRVDEKIRSVRYAKLNENYIYAARFEKCDEKLSGYSKALFMIEEVYQYDENIPWFRFENKGDVPDNAVKCTEKLPELCNINW